VTNLHRSFLFAATTALSTVLAAPAFAAFITYNIAGTWEGKLTCNELVNGVKTKTVRTPTMKISQAGLNFGVELDFGGGNTVFYGGLTNPDKKKPENKGEAALIRCGSTDVLDQFNGVEMVRIKASTKPGKVKASISGQAIFSAANVAPDHGTCKWKWKRTDDVDPGLLTQCALPALHTPPHVSARRFGGAL
jgi:hypothetical protein